MCSCLHSCLGAVRAVAIVSVDIFSSTFQKEKVYWTTVLNSFVEIDSACCSALATTNISMVVNLYRAVRAQATHPASLPPLHWSLLTSSFVVVHHLHMSF